MESVLEHPEPKSEIMVLVGREYLKKQKQTIAELESQLQATSTALNTANFALDMTKTKITELEGKIVEKEGKMNAVSDRNRELEEKQANFDTEINTVKEQKTIVEIKNQELDDKLTSLKSQFNAIKDENSNKNQTITDLDLQITGYRNELEGIRNERNTFRSEISSLRDQIIELQKISDGATGQAGQLDQALQNANMQLKTLEIQLSTLENKMQTIELENITLKKQIREFETTHSGDISQISDLQEKLTQITNKNAEMGMELLNSNRNCDSIHQNAIQKENEFQITIETLKNSTAILEGKNQELLGVISMRDQKILEFEHSFQTQGEILARKESEIKEWQEKFTEIETQLKGPVKQTTDAARITCPQCHAIDISKVEDKKKVLSYIGYMPIYAKKNQCRKCGYNWV